jgi:DnaK suppressor protein
VAGAFLRHLQEVVVSALLSSGTPTAASDVRAALERLEAECLRARAGVMAALAEEGPEPVLSARAESLQRTLDEIGAARGRLDAGIYGRCVACGGTIPAPRLELRPFAATCVPCAGAAR